MTKVYDTATDLITFARGSSGTALRRVGYGENLVTNGDFATTDISAWDSFDGTLAVVGGQLELTYTNATQYVWVEVTTTPGTLYEFSIDCRSDNAVGHKLVAYSDGFPSGTEIAVNPSFVNFSASLTTQTLRVRATTSTTLFMVSTQLTSGTAYFDNISVKEVIFDRATDPLVLFNHPDDTPRIEYGSDGSLKGLLIEEQRTNLVTYSDFSSGWTEVRASLNTTTQAGPDGIANSAVKMLGSSDNNTHFAYVNATITGDRTISVFAKAAELDWLILANTNFTSLAASYNLADGVTGSRVGTVTGFSDTFIEDVGNGWFRCSATIPSSTADGAFDFVVALGNGDNQYLFEGSASEGIYLYGAQLEEGSFATSYIPTSGSQQTRSKDIATIPVSAFGYNDQAGTIVVDFATLATFGSRTNDGVFSLRDNSGDNLVRMYLAANDNMNVQVQSNNIIVFTTGIQTDLPEQSETKAAIGFISGSYAASVDGGATQSLSTSTTYPVAGEITELAIGIINNDYLNGHIKSLQYYPRRLTDAQLQELTA